MDIVEAFVLAVVKGVTEWLPVGSAGHDVLMQHFFGLGGQEGFDIVLRLAALLVVLYVFRMDIIEIFRSLFAWRPGKGFMDDVYRRWAVVIAAGSIPVAVGGYIFSMAMTEVFSTLVSVGIAFLVTGFLLSMTGFVRKKNEMPTVLQGFIVGVFHALALFPGISRTGATISAGMLQGVSRENAARLSFLLFIPAIIGTALYKLPAARFDASLSVLFVAVITIMVVSYGTIELLLASVRKGYLHHFAWYCYAIGFVTLFLV